MTINRAESFTFKIRAAILDYLAHILGILTIREERHKAISHGTARKPLECKEGKSLDNQTVAKCHVKGTAYLPERMSTHCMQWV